MFSILKMLVASNPDTEKESGEMTSSSSVDNKYKDLREQPTLLSAVEGTLSSFYKEEGDMLLEKISNENIMIYFDDDLSRTPQEGKYEKEDNVIILSSEPNDVLEISKQLYALLKAI